MYRCNIQANALSSLLDTRSGIELVAEPYRLQSRVALCVAYSEYVNYVRSLTDSNAVNLASNTRIAITYANESNPKLYSCFLKDIAFAICKELWYAERDSADATVILPVAPQSSRFTIGRLLAIIKRDPIVREELDTLLAHTLYDTRLKSEHNRNLKEVAYALITLSHNKKFASELNLDYDLS